MRTSAAGPSRSASTASPDAAAVAPGCSSCSRSGLLLVFSLVTGAARADNATPGIYTLNPGQPRPPAPPALLRP